MKNLDFFISNSGDSILEEYFYSNGILSIVLYLNEIEKKFHLKIQTEHLAIDNYYLEKSEDIYRNCRAEIHDLSKNLSIENAIFVPPKRFEKLMEESRLNYNLAYGKKHTMFKYLFTLTGYGNLISCIVSDLSSINIHEMEEKESG